MASSLFPGPGDAASDITLDRADRISPPYGQEFHLPFGELRSPCGARFLPKIKGPSDVGSSVRLRRRKLALPVVLGQPFL